MRGFGELEAAVMDRVWSSPTPVTVRELLAALQSERPLAYTTVMTVMTVMDNLHRKGWLTREMDGRAYRYQAVRSREEHSASVMRRALADSSDEAATLVHFVQAMSPQEARALRQALDEGRPRRGSR